MFSAGKTFFANAGVQDGFEFGAFFGLLEDAGAQGIATDCAGCVEDAVAEGFVDFAGDRRVGFKQGADAGIGIEDDGTRPEIQDNSGDCGFAAGHATGESEDMHGRNMKQM